MTSRVPEALDVERGMGRALIGLLAALRGEAAQAVDGDSLAGTLAAHALVASVRGCVVCLIDDKTGLRVAGVAGETGAVEAGSTWQLAGSPVAHVLAGTSRMIVVAPLDSPLGAALNVPDGGELLATALRIGAPGDDEPTSFGATLLIREHATELTDEECTFLLDHASLVALALLSAAPAQDRAGRARRLRGDVDAAVELVGSIDADQVIPRLLRRTCEALDASRATLLRTERDEVFVEGAYDRDEGLVTPTWRGKLLDRPLLLEAMHADGVVVGVSPERFPVGLQDAVGSGRHVLIHPLRVGDGAATGFIAVVRRHPRPFIHDDSVTLQLLGQVALLALRNSRLYADAQAASHAMSSFLNLIVHDLRAPLTVLSGYVDLLRDGTFGDAPDAWRKPMEMIAGKLGETHRLVDELLLAARLESGAVTANIQTLDLNDIIARARVRSEARAGLARASIEWAPHTEAVVGSGDVFHVDRIVDNLINNAILYGGASPWIRLSVDPTRPPAIRVEDRGMGISAELHSRIFEPFFRVNNSVPGSGFGLHVGRVLAEACGGSLRLERSAPGQGSVFRLELPVPVTATT